MRDISSFISFALFYSDYIPFFEFRIQRLRKLTTLPYEHTLTCVDFDHDAQQEWNDIKKALLSDPLLRRADKNKRVYLRTDFSSKGFGFVVLQPGDDKISLDAMKREEEGGVCEFDINKKGPRLLPCAMGAKKLPEFQKHVHGSYGEGLSVRFAINKNTHLCLGREFTSITDCWSL